MNIPKMVPEPCPTCGAQRRRVNGAWLRARREQARISLRAVARQANVSAPFVSDVERNNRRPNAALMAIYEQLL